MNDTRRFLIFGDLHGRVLPAFRLAQRWEQDHGYTLDGLLQVGDLGYFPDLTRLDKATVRHAQKDASELGVQDVIAPNVMADAVFNRSSTSMWFTAGNHEDHDLLEAMMQRSREPAFPVDHYERVWCVSDGQIADLPDGLSIAAVWGIDNDAPGRRKSSSAAARIHAGRLNRLYAGGFDILLTHESPLDAVKIDSGSEEISMIIESAQPAFAFFGHYHEDGNLEACDFGRTRVHHLHGFELNGRDGSAEPRSVGLLQWQEEPTFEFLPERWLREFTRSNWKHF